MANLQAWNHDMQCLRFKELLSHKMDDKGKGFRRNEKCTCTNTHVNVAAQVRPLCWYFPAAHCVHAAIHMKPSFICRKSHLWMQSVIMNSLRIQLTEITGSHDCNYCTTVVLKCHSISNLLWSSSFLIFCHFLVKALERLTWQLLKSSSSITHLLLQ
jgi:hypothetical protein